MWDAIHYIDIALWLVVAASTAYVGFFAIISLFYSKDENYIYNKSSRIVSQEQHRFLILFPAYNEDAVIVNSIEQFTYQEYPQELYTVAVISDHMTDETNARLSKYPITLLRPTFEKSSKAKAMQYALDHVSEAFDFIVVLDADNVVQPSFLRQLNVLCNSGYDAIQCHRCAKNSNNDVAVLDGVSEEINNTIFRKAHNRIGLSSALIGSGMCFRYELFKKNVFELTTAGEDREMEALLLKQNVFIKYAADIHVFDEKVSNKDNFQRQRMRWMTAQVQSLVRQLPYIPRAVLHGNVNYVDKTIQQALIPRSFLIVIIGGMAVLLSLLVPVWAGKWWALLAILAVALIIATPKELRSRTVFGKLLTLPNLVWRMVKNLLHLDIKNTDFLHTTHNK